METAIVIGGASILYLARESVKMLKRKRLKNKMKTRLIEAFLVKDLSKIKKYICHIKDYDTKYHTKKLEKYLVKIVRHNKKVNEEMVMTLLKDFAMLDKIYDDASQYEGRLESLLGDKLDEVERRRKEAIIRENKIKQRLSMRNAKAERAKPTRKRSGVC